MKDGLDAKPLLVAAIRPFSCFDAPKLPMKAEPPLLLPTCNPQEPGLNDFAETCAVL